MALQTSGSGAVPALSMSLSDINVELGESSLQLIDFYGAATSFSGILDDGQVEILEFYNKTFSAGSGPYGSRALHFFRFINDGGSKQGWQDGELVSAAENSLANLTDAAQSGYAIVEETDFVGYEVDDGQITNGDTIYENSTGVTLTNLRPGGDFPVGTQVLLDTTANKIFQIDTSAVVSNLTSRTPATPTITQESKTSGTIVIGITGSTVVTRQYAPFLDGVEQTNVVPSSSGSLSDTTTLSTYTYTGLNSNTSYALKVRGENIYANGSDSNTLNITTDVGVVWTNNTSSISITSNLGNYGSQDILLASGHAGGPYAIEVTIGNGGTSVSVAQPSAGTLELRYADNSSMTGASSFATSHTGLSDLTTKWYYQLRYTEQGVNTDHTSTNNIITWSNNGVSDTTTGVNITFTNTQGTPP